MSLVSEIVQKVSDYTANSNYANKDKVKVLNELLEKIEEEKKHLDGTWTYCEHCKEWYLSKSFQTETETRTTKVCTYEDPINSGGNDYADGYVDLVFSICPKAHKFEISRQERLKK